MPRDLPDPQPGSTPATPDTHTGSATETHGANTNLSPDLQGGPISSADRAATQEATEGSSAPRDDAQTRDTPG